MAQEGRKVNKKNLWDDIALRLQWGMAGEGERTRSSLVPRWRGEILFQEESQIHRVASLEVVRKIIPMRLSPPLLVFVRYAVGKTHGGVSHFENFQNSLPCKLEFFSSRSTSVLDDSLSEERLYTKWIRKKGNAYETRLTFSFLRQSRYKLDPLYHR